MKKLSIIAIAAVAIMFASCGKKASQANLKTQEDSLAYAIGVAQSQGLKGYLAQNGIDSTMYDEFMEGIAEGLKADNNDPKQKARLMGMQVGQNFAGNLPQMNQEFFGQDSTKSINMNLLMSGLLAELTGEKTIMTPEQAQVNVQRLIAAVKAEANKEVIAKAEAFMKKYANNKEYKQLGNTGIYYKVIKEGKGEKPTADANVKVNYEGKNMDGKVFDSSYERKEPAVMNVGQVIPGWQEVLKAMPVGSTWEIVVPYNLAYGERAMSENLPAYSSLVFKIELISIEKDAPKPQAQPIQIQ